VPTTTPTSNGNKAQTLTASEIVKRAIAKNKLMQSVQQPAVTDPAPVKPAAEPIKEAEMPVKLTSVPIEFP